MQPCSLWGCWAVPRSSAAWQDVRPTSFLNVANSLNGDYVVVRPDHLFQLIRESKGLPINPVSSYSLTASAGAHGGISPNGRVVVNQNEHETFTFTPNSGYVVQAVSVDGVGTAVGPSYTFSNVTADHTISVAFVGSAVAADGGAVDASAPDASAAGASHLDAGVAADARNQTGHCGCRMPKASASAAPGWCFLGLLVLAGRRRGRNVARPWFREVFRKSRAAPPKARTMPAVTRDHQ